MDAAHWGPPGWPQLPAELLREVARRVAGADELALTKTLLRLVCTGWHAALPIGECWALADTMSHLPVSMLSANSGHACMHGAGHPASQEAPAFVPALAHGTPSPSPLPAGLAVPAKIWRWEEAMQRALAPHAQHIEVLAPLPALSDSPLPQLAACRRLRRLALRHIHAAALPALGALGGLESLDAHVFFPAALDGWLDWAAGLRSLQDLRLTAAVLRLQAEDGLAALLPLKATLRELRLDGCVLLTDTGAAVLAQLR